MGASLAAFSIEQLLIPNRIIDGRVIGSSLILDLFNSRLNRRFINIYKCRSIGYTTFVVKS
ncbi:hypothetical protein [Parageobacillus toebii]|uniref:hypothetical protein n=1 Tax=Parageobacillus toebii TaxID=153151 RepID=UPI002E2343D6